KRVLYQAEPRPDTEEESTASARCRGKPILHEGPDVAARRPLLAGLQRVQRRIGARRRRRLVAFEHQPQDPVVELVVDAIGTAEVEILRKPRRGRVLRVLRVEVGLWD